MSVDATARRANIKDSIKKFFIDNLYTTEGIHLGFDTTLATPKVQGKSISRWVVIQLGVLDRQDGSLLIHVHCCTRKDNEGFKLAQLTDTVMDYLTDSIADDSCRRVPLYRSRAVGAWTQLDGGFIVLIDDESPEMQADDDSKFITIDTIWRFGTKI